jgi:serine/threonine protein kinase
VLSSGDVLRCGRSRVSLEVIDAANGDDTVIKTPAPDVALPDMLAGYSIIREIGRGGMGRVLLGKHRSNGRPAAIKVLIPEFAAETGQLAMFVREASVLSRLRHSRIVSVLDFGIQDSWPFLVLEYVPALSLLEFLKQSDPRDRIRLACRITSSVLEGLDYAHAQGFVHRDIKPGNILAYRHPEDGKLHVKLADFGLAKSFQDAGMSGMTGSRETRGTVVYMSPEQVLDSRSAGPSADIYSAGATLYHLLTDSTPFKAQTFSAALSAVLNSAPIPVHTVAPQIPLKLAELVHRALAREPERRFASAGQMREALREFGKRG